MGRPRRTEAMLPFAPLLALIDDDHGYEAGNGGGWHTLSRLTTLAERTGIPKRSFSRWAAAGVMPITAADRVACALGYHPLLIWGDEFHAGVPA